MMWNVCYVHSGACMAVWGSNPGAVKRPCPDRLWGPPRLYRIGTGFLSRRKSGRDMKLAPHSHIVTRLRMGGAIHLLPLYALIAWSGNSLPFHLPTYNPLDLKRSSKTTLQKLPFPNLLLAGSFKHATSPLYQCSSLCLQVPRLRPFVLLIRAALRRRYLQHCWNDTACDKYASHVPHSEDASE